MYVRRKNRLFFSTTSARCSNGTKATNIKKVNGDTGHAAQSNIPDKKLRPKVTDFFKTVVVLRIGLQGRKVVKYYEVEAY